MNHQSNLLEVYLKIRELNELVASHGQYPFLSYLLNMAVIEAEFQYELERRRAEFREPQATFAIAA